LATDFLHKWRCLASCFWLCLALPAAAESRNSVFVPSFWDPQHHLEKPDLAGLHSIRFLTEDDYPPFHFALSDGTLAGFDIDLARAVCEELKVVCTIQARRWDTLVDSLADSRGDALIASIRSTAENRAKLDFTAPYYATPARFITLATSTLDEMTPEALAGKIIGVEARSAHEAYLKSFYPSVILKVFDTPAAARGALRRGEVAALFGDGISLSFWLNGTEAQNCCSFRGGPFTESRYFGEGISIAVKKDNAVLRRTLDYALAMLAEHGTYTDLYLKYFPIGFY
jgi:polar amino acid transport system substrate-binding protein